MSKIEWTDRTWNPVTGCTKVSPGCDRCYAEGIARRFAGSKAFPNGFDVTVHPERLDAPRRWRKPARVFVNSMSDFFHDLVPEHFIKQVWTVMQDTPQHTYQILTKRHSRMRALLRGTDPLPNVWLGVSVEDQKRADLRIPALLGTPAAVRFVSCEPLLGPVDLRLAGSAPSLLRDGEMASWRRAIDWVIVGGESGPGARPMHPDWARQLRDQCVDAGVPFFFKQWGAHIPLDHSRGLYGGIRDVTIDGDWSRHDRERDDGAVPVVPFVKRSHGRELDGRTWDEFPLVIA